MSEKEFVAKNPIQFKTSPIEMSKECTILEALPIPSVITGLDLRILEFNDSWKRFVLKHGLREGDCKSGAYYTEVCDPALRGNDEYSKSLTEGMNRLLTGKVARFKMEYQTTHHLPSRRIRLSMNLINGTDWKGILILHFVITGKIQESSTIEKTVRHLKSESLLDQSVSSLDSVGLSGGILPQIHQKVENTLTVSITPWEWDIPSDSLRASSEACKIFGFNPGEEKLKFDSITTRIHPKERAAVMQRFAELLFTGRPFRMRHRVVPPNGIECYILSRAIMHYGEEGVPSCVTGFFVDITNQDIRGHELELLIGAFVDAFNKSLTIIRNCASSILTDLHNAHRARQNALEIKKSVEEIQCLSRLLPLLGEEEHSAHVAH